MIARPPKTDPKIIGNEDLRLYIVIIVFVLVGTVLVVAIAITILHQKNAIVSI